MLKEYVNPEIEIINFDEESILTSSAVVGNTTMPGEERVDGSDLFGWLLGGKWNVKKENSIFMNFTC